MAGSPFVGCRNEERGSRVGLAVRFLDLQLIAMEHHTALLLVEGLSGAVRNACDTT